MIEQLSANSVHLYLVYPKNVNDPLLLDQYRKLLSEPERQRYQSIRFEQHRHQFLVTRALVRTTLSAYHPLAPEQWQFTKNRYGRPEIKLQKGMPELRFNISHTDGLIVCAIGLRKDLGVDVENLNRKNQLLAIAERYFSKNEVKHLKQLTGDAQNRLFYQLWTLKEAYIKACGMGLAIPLNRISFFIENAEDNNIMFSDNDAPGLSKQWRFRLLNPQGPHQIAIALKSGNEIGFNLNCFNVVPLNQYSVPFIRKPHE